MRNGIFIRIKKLAVIDFINERQIRNDTYSYLTSILIRLGEILAMAAAYLEVYFGQKEDSI